MFPASILSACSLPNDSGLTERKQSRPAWPWFSLRTASFIATKASPRPPPLAEDLPLEAAKNGRPKRLHSCRLVRVLNWSPEERLLVALGSWTRRPPESESAAGGKNVRKWVAWRGLVKDSGLQSWSQPAQSRSGRARDPHSLLLSPRPCASLARVGRARSAPSVPLPGQGELCAGRCCLLINDDASGSCATSSLSSPLWPHPVHSKVKSRPVGLDFSVEGLLCVSFFIH